MRDRSSVVIHPGATDRTPPPAAASGARRGIGVALAVVVLLGIAARLNGLTNSFWMDEAWVANSLIEPTWSGVFYYSKWLQTSPPGFLALAASTVALVGDSHVAFRLVPLISGFLGLGLVVWMSRRLSPAFGLLTVLLVALSPTAIDYSRMLKQYSTDLAFAALLVAMAWRYVDRPSRARFVALAGTLAAGMACAYGAVFTACGVLALTSPLFALAVEGRRPATRDVLRWLVLVAIMAGVLAVEYVWFYLPNNSPELRRFWQVVSINRRDNDVLQILFRNFVILARHTPLPTSLYAPGILLGATAVAAGAVMGLVDASRRRVTGIVLCLGALPAAALLVAGWLDIYPNFERTSLFLLPGLALLAGYYGQVVYETTCP
jgi:predicted membrane-bound mannosyltransferase